MGRVCLFVCLFVLRESIEVLGRKVVTSARDVDEDERLQVVAEQLERAHERPERIVVAEERPAVLDAVGESVGRLAVVHVQDVAVAVLQLALDGVVARQVDALLKAATLVEVDGHLVCAQHVQVDRLAVRLGLQVRQQGVEKQRGLKNNNNNNNNKKENDILQFCKNVCRVVFV